MAKSDRKCPTKSCSMFDKPTNHMVWHSCLHATVHSIYQPRTATTT